MSDHDGNTTTQPVEVVKVKSDAKAVLVAALVRRLGLERSMRAVATARKFDQARLGFPSGAKFSVSEVEDLLTLERVHVSADELAAVVKVKVAEVLG